MTDKQLFDVAAAAVRLWTRLYTWRLEPELRSERLAEIESDLWEARHDTPPLAAWQVLLRLGRGIPADLVWQGGERWDSLLRPVSIAIAGMTVTITYWMIAIAALV